MKFLAGFVAFSAAISQTLAVALTNSGYEITEGEPFTFTWSDAEGEVTLLLKDGPSNDLDTVTTIACKFGSQSLPICMTVANALFLCSGCDGLFVHLDSFGHCKRHLRHRD